MTANEAPERSAGETSYQSPEVVERLVKECWNYAWWRAKRFYWRFQSSMALELEDVGGVALLNLFLAARSWIPEKGRFLPYACVAITNGFIDCFFTKPKKEPPLVPMENYQGRSLLSSAGTPSLSPEEEVSQREAIEVVEKCLSTLPPRQVAVLHAKLSGASFSQVAQDLGVTKQRAQQLFKMGLRLLQKRVQNPKHTQEERQERGEEKRKIRVQRALNARAAHQLEALKGSCEAFSEAVYETARELRALREKVEQPEPALVDPVTHLPTSLCFGKP